MLRKVIDSFSNFVEHAIFVFTTKWLIHNDWDHIFNIGYRPNMKLTEFNAFDHFFMKCQMF